MNEDDEDEGRLMEFRRRPQNNKEAVMETRQLYVWLLKRKQTRVDIMTDSTTDILNPLRSRNVDLLYINNKGVGLCRSGVKVDAPLTLK